MIGFDTADRNDVGIWVKEQSAAGVFAMPAASDCVIVTAPPTPDQPRTSIDNKELVAGLTEPHPIRGLYREGTVTVNMYIKAAGALGVRPPGAAMFKAAFGREEIAAGSSVTYKLARRRIDAMPKVSMIIWSDFDTWFLTDAVVSVASMDVSAEDGADAAPAATFEVKYSAAALAGTTTVRTAIDGSVTPVSVIPVTDAQLYDVGAYVAIGSQTNSGAGYRVTAADTTAATITVSPAVNAAVPQDAIVQGHRPAVTVSGLTMHGQFGLLDETPNGGSTAPIPVTKVSVKIDNRLSWGNKEKRNNPAPSVLSRDGLRQITGELSRIVTIDAQATLAAARSGKKRLLAINIADSPDCTPGHRARIVMPDVVFISGKKGDSGADVSATIQFHAADSAAGDDAISVIFD